MEVVNPIEAHDRKFHETRSKDWLPNYIIDAYNHAHLRKFYMGAHLRKHNQSALWPLLAAEKNSVQDIEEIYRNLFPDKKVTPPLLFGKVSRAFDVEACTNYVIDQCGKSNCPYLHVIRPQ